LEIVTWEGRAECRIYRPQLLILVAHEREKSDSPGYIIRKFISGQKRKHWDQESTPKISKVQASRRIHQATNTMATAVHVTCLCGKHTELVELKSKLPVPSAPCSCNSCRYTTGVLYFSDLPLTTKPALVARLTKYDSSSKLSRYFCPKCGSYMFVEVHGDVNCHVHGPHTWSVASGVIDRIEGLEIGPDFSLERIEQHEFVGDAKDAGISVCLREGGEHRIPIFLQGPDGPKFDGPGDELLSWCAESSSGEGGSVKEDVVENSRGEGFLQAGCHCKGVQFQVTRPDPTSRNCSSPWPDLIVPFHASSSENPEDVKWWLRADDTKYLAGTCTCRSCRLGSGSPIQTWAFIPKANIRQLNGDVLDYAMGTLKQIESSDGCYREFCSTCGATVFWHCDFRPDLVDVSVGLLRASEGSRASTWLDWWTERVSFREDALDKKLVQQLEQNLSNLKMGT
jgi:hypothetical protein